MKVLRSKKVLLAVIVLVCLVIGVVLYRNHNKPKAPTITAPTTAVVSMGEDGFSPQTLKIKVGTTVVFKNDGAEQHQVESNPHPEHTDLPGLDSKTALSSGATYTYKFTKAGTFHYHNELEPDENGTIIVE